jgi:hypothetical protein
MFFNSEQPHAVVFTHVAAGLRDQWGAMNMFCCHTGERRQPTVKEQIEAQKQDNNM